VSSTTRSVSSAIRDRAADSPEKKRRAASPKAAGRPLECATKEHKGEGADIFGWTTFGGQAKFKSRYSGFSLDRPHSVVDVRTATAEDPDRAARASSSPDQLPGAPPLAPRRIARPRGPAASACHDAKSWRPLEPMNFDTNKTPAFRWRPSTSAALQQLSPKSMFRLA